MNYNDILIKYTDKCPYDEPIFIEEIKAYFKEKVYDTIIPRLIKLSEAPSHGKPILAYDPKNRGTVAYLNLAKEVIDHNGK